MRTRPRACRVLAWSLTALLTLLAIAWLLSIRYYAEYEGVTFRMEIVSGQVYTKYAIGLGPTPIDSSLCGWTVHTIPIQARGADPLNYGFILPRHETSSIPLLKFFVPGTQAKLVHSSIPFWVPMAALAIPTALLWYRGRRRPTEGHCPNCNYNLTANESGKCPECGTKLGWVPAETHRAAVHLRGEEYSDGLRTTKP